MFQLPSYCWRQPSSCNESKLGQSSWMRRRYWDVECSGVPGSRWAVLKRHLLKRRAPQPCTPGAGVYCPSGETGSGEKMTEQMKSYFWQAGLYNCVSLKLHWLYQFVYAKACVISLFWRRIKSRKKNINWHALKLGRSWVYGKKGGNGEEQGSSQCMLHVARLHSEWNRCE